MPSGAIFSSVMTGERLRDLAERLALAALLEQEVGDDEVERRDVGAHADRLEILLRLAVGPDRRRQLARLAQERREAPLHLRERERSLSR